MTNLCHYENGPSNIKITAKTRDAFGIMSNIFDGAVFQK